MPRDPEQDRPEQARPAPGGEVLIPRGADPRVEELRTTLRHRRPVDAVERRSQDRTLQALATLAAPFDQHADPTHVTGSAIITDGSGRVVLHRHKRLGIWLQPGGHIDGAETPAAAAVRETLEETGLPVRHPVDGPDLLHVDVHPGPRGHLHLDIRYRLVADEGHVFAPGPGESPTVAWFSIEEARGVADASLAAALRALQQR